MSDILIDTTLTYQWNTGATTPQISDKPATTTTYTVVVSFPVHRKRTGRCLYL